MTKVVVLGKPMPLASNKGKSFQGSIVLGKGFVLSLEEAEKLIKKDPRNKEVLFPYLNGDDLNNDPEQKPSRWVINFFDWDEERARSYPDCFEIVERLVKPERLIQKDKGSKEKWWQFLRARKELYNTISELDQVMVLNRHAKHLLISISKNNIVFSEATVIFALNTFSEFAILNSSIHDIWAWKNSSTMGTSTLRYSGTNAFETFPFPLIISHQLDNFGRELHLTRLEIMKRYKLGLTDLQNKFHDTNINDKSEIYNDIIKLRQILELIDKELIKLHGWSDIRLNHNFYELDHLPENDRVRFTINPTVRKEILKRLLLLNLNLNNEEKKNNTSNIQISKKSKKPNSKISNNTLFPED